MPGVVFKSMEEFQQMAKAVNAVNRGALEHPFHRRRGPVLQSNDLELMVLTADEDIPLGPNGGSGPNIGTSGMAHIVNPTTREADEDHEYELNTLWIGSNLLFPAYVTGTVGALLYPSNTCWALNLGDAYYAVHGGTPTFEGVMASVSTATIYSPPTMVGYGPVNVRVACGFQIIPGTSVTITMSGPTLLVIGECCPPEAT